MRDDPELYAQIQELKGHLGSDSSLSSKDIAFGKSLVDSYFAKGTLSIKQKPYIQILLKRAGANPTQTGVSNGVEEIFSGQIITALLRKASEELKFPRLRYATDQGCKIVFSFVADKGSKWSGCTFIDNGARAEGKKRYGFINSLGNGRIRRESPIEIKTLIRKIASDPVEIAKLQGQKYKNCCFCGLELTNKSSLHHGYGPICAEKYGLPWGDTGDIKDEEEAAVKEAEHLKNVALVDLEGEAYGQ